MILVVFLKNYSRNNILHLAHLSSKKCCVIYLKLIRLSSHKIVDLDHGDWSVLQSLFTAADVPVFQLSLDVNLDFSDHFALARKFAILREQGVMVIASGNIVHNLPRLMRSEINVD